MDPSSPSRRNTRTRAGARGALLTTRELAVRESDRASILGAVLTPWTTWSCVLSGLMALAGVLVGLHSDRGVAILVLAPSVAVYSLSGYRQVFLVLYETRVLVRIDLAFTALQVLLVTGSVAIGLGVLGAASAMTIVALLNSAAVAVLARRRIMPATGARRERGALLRAGAYIGTASLLSTVYYTVDLAIVSWLATASAVGHYAAAVKVLNILVAIPSVMMTSGLPALSAAWDSGERLSALAARVWHWSLAIGLPVCVGTGVFAPLVIRVLFGSKYRAAAPLLRVLVLAGIVCLLGSMLESILIGQLKGRSQVAINALALVFNVALNIALVPRYGVLASAWITVATEVVFAAGALWALRGRVRLAPSLRVTWQPILSAAAAGAVGLALGKHLALAIPASCVVYVALTYRLKAWPTEWSPGARGAGVSSRRRTS